MEQAGRAIAGEQAHQGLGFTESAAIVQVGVDAIEVRVVVHVNGFKTDLHPDGLGDSEVFKHRGVPAVEPGTAEDVASKTTKANTAGGVAWVYEE